MELIEIVDENGNFTGEVVQREEAYDRNLLYNVIGVFIINNKNQVLLQKRNSNKRFEPNKWSICSGHVIAYESLESAALRELREEVGLNISIDELHAFGEREIYINSRIVYFYYVKSNLDEKDFLIQKEELSKVKWFDIDEVIKRILANDDKLALKKNRITLLEQLKNK